MDQHIACSVPTDHRSRNTSVTHLRQRKKGAPNAAAMQFQRSINPHLNTTPTTTTSTPSEKLPSEAQSQARHDRIARRSRLPRRGVPRARARPKLGTVRAHDVVAAGRAQAAADARRARGAQVQRRRRRRRRDAPVRRHDRHAEAAIPGSHATPVEGGRAGGVVRLARLVRRVARRAVCVRGRDVREWEVGVRHVRDRARVRGSRRACRRRRHRRGGSEDRRRRRRRCGRAAQNSPSARLQRARTSRACGTAGYVVRSVGGAEGARGAAGAAIGVFVGGAGVEVDGTVAVSFEELMVRAGREGLVCREHGVGLVEGGEVEGGDREEEEWYEKGAAGPHSDRAQGFAGMQQYFTWMRRIYLGER